MKAESETHAKRLNIFHQQRFSFTPQLKRKAWKRRLETVMPIYEFECPDGTVTEKFVKMGTKEIECPKCHQKAKKLISHCTFELKGGGWYADGYASGKKKI